MLHTDFLDCEILNSNEKISKNFNPCKKRKVGRYDFEGNLLETFDTVRECRKQYANVSKVLKGTASHCKGFVFKYIE